MLINTQFHKINAIPQCLCHYIGFNWRNILLLFILFVPNTHFCRKSNFVANKCFLTQIFTQKTQILLRILSKKWPLKPLKPPPKATKTLLQSESVDEIYITAQLLWGRWQWLGNLTMIMTSPRLLPCKWLSGSRSINLAVCTKSLRIWENLCEESFLTHKPPNKGRVKQIP